MSDYLAKVIEQVQHWDSARERSQQTALGWSDIHGCRAHMGYQLDGTWPTDDPDEWGAINGTALHDWWMPLRREALAAEGVDTDRDYAWEAEVEYGGVPGHADEVAYALGEVTDLKTTTLKSLSVWDDPAVLDEKFVQPMGYAAGVTDTERWVFSAPKGRMLKPLVRMLVVPRDGKFSDWRMYEREFDRDVADAALNRYAETLAMREQGMELPRDKPMFWCSRFCEFFSLCRGTEDGRPEEPPEIADAEIAAALEAYGLAMEAKGEAGRAQELYAGLLRGGYGQARGWKLGMTKPGRGGNVDDVAAMRELLELADIPVPQEWKPGAEPRLNVSRIDK